jgi:hypothetical protein
MNLDLATYDTFERTVIRPLVTSVERLAIDRESSTDRLLEIPALERRIGRLDAQMMRHTNVTMVRTWTKSCVIQVVETTIRVEWQLCS